MLRQRMILGCFGVALILLAGCPPKGGAGGPARGDGTGGVSSSGTGGTKPSATGGTGGGGTAGMGTGGATATGGTGGMSESGTGGSQGGVCNLACVQGKHCELVQVTCVRAPCPPLPQCVDDAPASGPQCGGIAGLPCPGMAECVDNPTDNCDPMKGGADCGGLCVCNKGVLCVKGMMWNGSPSVCACVPAAGDAGGSACGKTTCPSGQVCCNASCGTCTPPGYACTQQACL